MLEEVLFTAAGIQGDTAVWADGLATSYKAGCPCNKIKQWCPKCVLQRSHAPKCVLQRSYAPECVLQRSHAPECVLQRSHDPKCVV